MLKTPKFEVLIHASLKAYLSEIIAILFKMPIVSFEWKQVVWPKMLCERESTERNSPARPYRPSLHPLFFVSFGSAGDGHLCVGPIMLTLALAVVIVRHENGRFKAKKFMKSSKAQLKLWCE